MNKILHNTHQSMTEKAAPLSTAAVIPSQTPPVQPAGSPILNEQSAQSEGADEEPYTIKCICTFTDDDGNTIYCEACDTWQHIDCFYPNNREEAIREDFAHACADCNPRALDRKRAKERSFGVSQGTVGDASDKKTKRPPTKGHRKKPKPVDTQLNGTNGSHENGKHGSPTEHPHPRKPKSHKASHSMSSQAPKRSPSHVNHKAGGQHASDPLPSLPEGFPIHDYTPRFRSLYDGTPFTEIENYTWGKVGVLDHLSTWSQDPSKMKEQTGHGPLGVVRHMTPDLEAKKPHLIVDDVSQKIITSTGIDTIRRQFLKSTSTIEKDSPLMELFGVVEMQEVYCARPENLWGELSHPLPFVFFHPQLPLCIDARKEGSLARYVRRSCKPNAILDTFISGTQYHFWLVSDQSISPDEAITISWEPGFPKDIGSRWLRLLYLEDEDLGPNDPEMTLEEYNQIADWSHSVLSEHGGCACGLGEDCAFAKFHRRWLYLKEKAEKPQGTKTKKARKNRTHTISPTSTGHATNSRAASEGQNEDDADNDGASQSGSSRSKPPSRERTPARQGSLDKPGILTELTDREKRKVAMAEDHFRRMEDKQPPRKKKRVSDGTSTSGTSKPKSRNGSIAPAGQYVDAGTSRRTSGSPASLRSPNAPNASKLPTSRKTSSSKQARQVPARPKVTYADASAQTDPVEGAWYSLPASPARPQKRVISLSRRLLNNKHRMQVEEELRQSQMQSIPTPVSTAMDVDSPTEAKPPTGTSEAADSPKTSPSIDTHMFDAASEAPNGLMTAPIGEEPTKTKTPDLRMQMPPVPPFDNTALTAPNTATPLSATGSTTQSPFAGTPLGGFQTNGLAAPSPVKKKLSLSDYTKARKNKAAGNTTGGPVSALKPSVDEIKTENGSEMPAPKKEEDSTTTTTTTNTGTTNGVM